MENKRSKEVLFSIEDLHMWLLGSWATFYVTLYKELFRSYSTTVCTRLGDTGVLENQVQPNVSLVNGNTITVRV